MAPLIWIIRYLKISYATLDFQVNLPNFLSNIISSTDTSILSNGGLGRGYLFSMFLEAIRHLMGETSIFLSPWDILNYSRTSLLIVLPVKYKFIGVVEESPTLIKTQQNR